MEDNSTSGTPSSAPQDAGASGDGEGKLWLLALITVVPVVILWLIRDWLI